MKSFRSILSELENAPNKLDALPKGKIFDDAVDISKIFKKSSRTNNQVLVDFENAEDSARLANVRLSDIHITQPNVTKNKVNRFVNKLGELSPIPAVKYENEISIPDGHHRLVAHWAAGKTSITVKLVIKDS
jgi:hypothetical protein